MDPAALNIRQSSCRRRNRSSSAPNNESYLINILKFIKVIDDEGKKTAKATSILSKHEDADFQKAFSDLVESAYSELFQLHASTFQTLAGLTGHGDVPTAKPTANAPTKKAPAAKAAKKVVQRHSSLKTESGYKLMMAAFDDAQPLIKLTSLSSVSEIDEQKGFRFVFAVACGRSEMLEVTKLPFQMTSTPASTIFRLCRC